jgi:hypothetical protein
VNKIGFIRDVFPKPDTENRTPKNLPIQTIFEKYPGTAILFYIFHTGQIFKLLVSGQEWDSE